MSEKRTLLLVGATGFVGGHVRAAADEVGLRVIGAEREPRGTDLRCDLTDPSSVTEAVRSSSPDLVINMAGKASVGESWRTPAETFEVNTTGVVNLLEAVVEDAPSAHVACVSSGEVYAPTPEEDLPLSENSPVGPVNPYGASKASMEIVCRQYERARGTEIAVIRAFNQLGPGQSPKFVASDFARQVAKAEIAGARSIDLEVGDLSLTRDFIDVRDSARAYVAVSRERLQGTYNLCSGRPTSLSALVDEFRAATPLELTVKPTKARLRSAEVSVMFGSSEKLRGEIDWTPQTPLGETVPDLLRSWREVFEGPAPAASTEQGGRSG